MMRHSSRRGGGRVAVGFEVKKSCLLRQGGDLGSSPEPLIPVLLEKADFTTFGTVSEQKVVSDDEFSYAVG